jgi:hypothetical protein
VLKGELSLVGPRPHALEAKAADRLYQDVVYGYFARHRVKPGITGWAQVNGWRGETDTAEKTQKRVEHDLYYIDNWSVLSTSNMPDPDLCCRPRMLNRAGMDARSRVDGQRKTLANIVVAAQWRRVRSCSRAAIADA